MIIIYNSASSSSQTGMQPFKLLIRYILTPHPDSQKQQPFHTVSDRTIHYPVNSAHVYISRNEFSGCLAVEGRQLSGPANPTLYTAIKALLQNKYRGDVTLSCQACLQPYWAVWHRPSSMACVQGPVVWMLVKKIPIEGWAGCECGYSEPQHTLQDGPVLEVKLQGGCVCFFLGGGR